MSRWGGGAKLSRLQNLQLAGLLTDARIRDFRELARLDIAVYCRGETTRWGGDTLMPFQSNVPIVLDNVTVLPRDYVLADSSGGVIVPASCIRSVFHEAEAIAGDEAAVREIRSEDPRAATLEGDES
jgi:4-hydroxy-4-methyl-2-oxoglutarate aldolase